MDWQPIETAPKDGEHVLLLHEVPDGLEVAYGYWTGRAWWMAIWGELLDCEALKTGVGGWDFRACSLRPTHWMPLPPTKK